MKEIISISLGKHSNHLATHFWNSQDENLKVLPYQNDSNQSPDDLEAQLKENTVISYYEQEKSQQLIPRHIYIDFRDNFGNFSSCFSGSSNQNNITAEDVKSDVWFGQMETPMENSVKQSKFQSELQWIDQMYYDSQKYEDQGVDENQDPNEVEKREEEYDEEEEEQIDSSSMMAKMKQEGKSGNMQDMFAQFMKQEQTNYDEDKIDEKKQKKEKYFEEKKKLEEIQKKQSHELYHHYDFDNDVKFFTDYMQSQMSTKFNQMVVPHGHVSEDNFQFFNKGRELWNIESQFKDDLEDKIRLQLEVADCLQGFQVSCDSNSGFGSLSNQIIQYFLKDEAPKAPVYVYSINNSQVIDIDNDATEQERTNFQTRQKLIDINKSLYLSECEENIELLIPFDCMKIGSALKDKFSAFNKDSVFHQSGVHSLIYQNIYNILQNRKSHIDMAEFARQSLYQSTPINIVTSQLQIPMPHVKGDRYLQKIQKEHLTDSKYFVNFNNLNPLHEKRRPIRHTFILRGQNTLIDKDENPRVFSEQYDAFLFQNTAYERGLKSYVIKEPHYLPIPYPRYLNNEKISQDGLIRPEGSKGVEFLQQLPSQTKLMLDGRYLNHIESCYKNLKHISASTRFNLLRENDNMEEDEWRHKVEQLKILTENYQSIGLSEEPSDSSGADDDDY